MPQVLGSKGFALVLSKTSFSRLPEASMFFSREFLELCFGPSSAREAVAIRRRRRRKLSAGVQTLEGRTLLSHAGVVHVEHSVSAIVSKLDHRHGHSQEHGAHHKAHDDKGAHNH